MHRKRRSAARAAASRSAVTNVRSLEPSGRTPSGAAVAAESHVGLVQERGKRRDRPSGKTKRRKRAHQRELNGPARHPWSDEDSDSSLSDSGDSRPSMENGDVGADIVQPHQQQQSQQQMQQQNLHHQKQQQQAQQQQQQQKNKEEDLEHAARRQNSGGGPRGGVQADVQPRAGGADLVTKGAARKNRKRAKPGNAKLPPLPSLPLPGPPPEPVPESVSVVAAVEHSRSVSASAVVAAPHSAASEAEVSKDAGSRRAVVAQDKPHLSTSISTPSLRSKILAEGPTGSPARAASKKLPQHRSRDPLNVRHLSPLGGSTMPVQEPWHTAQYPPMDAVTTNESGSVLNPSGGSPRHRHALAEVQKELFDQHGISTTEVLRRLVTDSIVAPAEHHAILHVIGLCNNASILLVRLLYTFEEHGMTGETTAWFRCSLDRFISVRPQFGSPGNAVAAVSTAVAANALEQDTSVIPSPIAEAEATVAAAVDTAPEATANTDSSPPPKLVIRAAAAALAQPVSDPERQGEPGSAKSSAKSSASSSSSSSASSGSRSRGSHKGRLAAVDGFPIANNEAAGHVDQERQQLSHSDLPRSPTTRVEQNVLRKIHTRLLASREGALHTFDAQGSPLGSGLNTPPEGPQPQQRQQQRQQQQGEQQRSLRQKLHRLHQNDPHKLDPTSPALAPLDGVGLFRDSPDPGGARKPPRKVIIVGSGAFNPMHKMHLRMFYLAKQYLETHSNSEVIGGLVSPSHATMVRHKLRRTPREIIPCGHRLAIARLAVGESSWLTVDPWEMTRRRMMDYLSVLEHVKELVTTHLGLKDVRIVYLCKANQLLRVSPDALRKAGFSCLCICRPLEQEYLATKMGPRWKGVGCILEDRAMLSLALEQTSSSRIRQDLINGAVRAVETMVGPKMARYLEAHRCGQKMAPPSMPESLSWTQQDKDLLRQFTEAGDQPYVTKPRRVRPRSPASETVAMRERDQSTRNRARQRTAQHAAAVAVAATTATPSGA